MKKRLGKPKEPMLSLIIPLYNEAACIEGNLRTVQTYLETTKWEHEVLLVNDGSTDQTAAIVNQVARDNPRVQLITRAKNHGKGYAIRQGMSQAKGQYVIFTDADLAVPEIFLGMCMRELEGGSHVVIGSRHLPDSSFEIRESPLRQLLGEIFRRVTQLSFRLDVSDVTCGLKGFRKECADQIFSRSRLNRWGYDVEILFLAQKLGYHITEIPVRWYHSFDSRVRVGIDSARTLIEMGQVYHYYLHGLYRL